jgi:nitrite reductase (NADH) small subunit
MSVDRVVCRTSDLAEGRGRVVEVDGLEIAVFVVEGRVYALENACPHRGGPLAFGDLRGRTVHCPLHAWPFDLATGGCPDHPDRPARAFVARVRGDEVRVEL